MNKIEEILQSKETYDPEYHTISISDALEAMKEFGKICFKNARKFKKTLERDGYDEYLYKTYEEFLNEIENEADNND
jgi:hypothetical protein